MEENGDARKKNYGWLGNNVLHHQVLQAYGEGPHAYFPLRKDQ